MGGDTHLEMLEFRGGAAEGLKPSCASVGLVMPPAVRVLGGTAGSAPGGGATGALATGGADDATGGASGGATEAAGAVTGGAAVGAAVGGGAALGAAVGGGRAALATLAGTAALDGGGAEAVGGSSLAD